MPKNKKRIVVPPIEEEVKIAVTMAIKQFKLDATAKEYTFPSSLTSEQRAYVHQTALENNLKSKSRGKGPNRFVTVFKPEGCTIMQNDGTMEIGPASQNEINTLILQFPVAAKERQDIMPYIDRDNTDLRRMDPSLLIRNGMNGRMEVNKVRDTTRMLGRLNTGVPGIPPVPTPPPHLMKVREELPIAAMRDEIITLINGNQVVVISGETGSGKTTQVPQFILEHCQANSKSCRIICAEPRRISAVSVSERVAAERGEDLGYIVGYQIRLESTTSPRCLLTYCTYGVLLRSLMVGDAALSATTHVIVDEVHERDRHCDFLMLVLRDMLARCRGLRLVLMSATLDLTMLTNYFRGAASISVPGRLFDVKEYFLEDILRETGFTNKKMLRYPEQGENQMASIQQWAQNNSKSDTVFSSADGNESSEQEHSKIQKWLIDDIDETMEEAWYYGNSDTFDKLLHLLRSQNVPIDHQHTYTSATTLMIAAARNQPEFVQKLLTLNANPDIKACNGYTALDWANELNNTDVIEILKNHNLEQSLDKNAISSSSQPVYDLTDEDKARLEIYQHSINDENVDLDLILCLLHQLHSAKAEGAILVFLPGYDDIVDLHDKIKEDKIFHSYGPYKVFLLHSNMQTNDQRQVFKPLPPNERKIILSTNIAETSITIDDVVFVIDSGKVKEKSFDALVGVCMLRSMWVSKACAQQRRGRAGRTQPGLCYHLFSRKRHHSMQPYQTPEILRLPLQELCLQTKMLAPFNTSIADFLAKAPEAPPAIVTRNAVNLLKMMDALTPCEDLTDLGQHLIDLPVEPRLGKALLFAIVLRCLDPVLTIICTLAYKEPFNLPSIPTLRKSAYAAKKKLAAGTHSDHMTLLRAFQLWQESRTKNRGRRFCDEYFVSSATLEMIMALRSQLLGQLRASGFVRTRGGSDLHELNMNSDNWAVIKAALTAGLYPNLARVDRGVYKLRTQNEARVTFHASSVLKQQHSAGKTVAEAQMAFLQELSTDWILFEEMSRAGHFCHIRTCTVVSPITVFLFAGSSHMAYDPQFDGEEDDARCQLAQELESDSEAEDTPNGNTTLLRLDDWISFRLSPDKARLAVQLRQKLHSLFIRRLRGPGKPVAQGDEQILKCVVNVLTAEEKALMLPQPLGIGQKPKSFEAGSSRAINDPGILDRQAKLLSPLEACLTRNSDSGSNVSSGSPCLSPTLSNDGSGSSGDLFPRTNSSIRYFIIKNGSLANIQQATTSMKWNFTSQTVRKLVKAQKEGKTVVLIFSVQRGGGFQGYARLGREDNNNIQLVRSIEWLRIGEIPSQAARHLLNPWCENQRVNHCRDGQELEPNVAEALCQIWNRTPVRRQNHFPPPPSSLPMPQFPSNPTMDHAAPVHMQSQFGRPIRGSYGYPGINGVYSSPHHNGHNNHSYRGRSAGGGGNKYY